MAAANPSQTIETNGSQTNLTSSSVSSVNSTTKQIPKPVEYNWLFTQDKIDNSPSRLDGLTVEQELKERQEAALFISDLGHQLQVNQLCINTAIIYMHRFFMIHSFKKFHRYVRMVATSCLFLACKVEEQPRRLSDLIGAIHHLFRKPSETYTKDEYRRYEEEIVMLESCLLQTLGFNVLINHAHTFIIKTCQMIKAPRDLAEAAYLTATNSLILTNFCVKFSSEKIACFCIFLACKGHDLIIPTSSEGLQWYQYVKHDIIEQELEDISKEYLTIYDKCLPMIQRKLGKLRSAEQQPSSHHQSAHRQSNPPTAQVKKPLHNEMHPPSSGGQAQPGPNVNMPHPSQHKQQPPSSAHKNPQLPNGSHHHQKHPGQSQQNRPSSQPTPSPTQNLNKSLPVTTQPHKQHNPQSQTLLKHPSSSNINPKTNGSIKSEPIEKNLFNPNKKPSIPPPIPPPPTSQQIKMSPSSSQSSTSSSNLTPTTQSMKRTNEELNNNITTAPNKIPKYVVDQKSAS